jgi:serine/threonine-protein kinase TTK/MPS1
LALKRIRLDGRENETIAGFIDEIKLLKTLRGRDNIIQLIDAEVCMNERLIFMVLEFGEIDLAHMLAKREKQRQGAVGAVDDNFLRLYFEQMVEAVNTIHEERIVHSDLKPANFLFVEGALKLIDFGIARAIQTEQAPDHTNIVRDHQVGTVNYMSPEAILNGQASALGGPMKVGRSSDIWSLGCILYQMVYGHTPFSKITGMIQKLHAITDPRHVIAFPPLPVDNPALIDLMQACLERNPKKRISVKEILRHKFLRPFAEPSSSSPTDSGLSMTQLQELLAQLQNHGSSVDVNAVTAEVFRQISAGESVTLSPLLRKHRRTDEDVDGVASMR